MAHSPPPYFIFMITLITATAVCLLEKIHVIFQANTEPKSFLEPLKELLTFMELPCLEFDWQVLMISKGGFFELGRFSVARLRSSCIKVYVYSGVSNSIDVKKWSTFFGEKLRENLNYRVPSKHFLGREVPPALIMRLTWNVWKIVLTTTTMWLHHFFSPTFFSPKTIDDPEPWSENSARYHWPFFDIEKRKEEKSCTLINH